MKIGRVSENAYKRSILQQLKTKCDEVVIGAGLGEDCAIFSFEKGICHKENDRDVIVSCLLEGPWSVDFLLTDALNRLAARGAKALAAAVQILLPLDCQEDVLKEIMVGAEQFAAGHNIQIAQASARVSGAVTSPFVTVVSYGRAENSDCHTVKFAKPGQDIVVSKWIGLKGTALLAQRYEKTLQERYPKWIVESAAEFTEWLGAEAEAAVAIKSGVCTILNVSEGGILASLWELAEGAGVGLTIDLKKLPIRQETVELCNYLNVNPYELLSGGCLLMTTKDGQGLVNALQEAGVPSVIVGKVTDSNDRLIINEDEVRYLDRPHPDSIFEKI